MFTANSSWTLRDDMIRSDRQTVGYAEKGEKAGMPSSGVSISTHEIFSCLTLFKQVLVREKMLKFVVTRFCCILCLSIAVRAQHVPGLGLHVNMYQGSVDNKHTECATASFLKSHQAIFLRLKPSSSFLACSPSSQHFYLAAYASQRLKTKSNGPFTVCIA